MKTWVISGAECATHFSLINILSSNARPCFGCSERQLLLALEDLWIAGMETTVTTMRWGFIYLANNPEVQKKIRDEIHDKIGKEVDLDSMPSMDRY